MKTLEMISDWEKSNCKKKYIRIVGNNNHYTVYNNGLGVLFYSYVNFTLNKTLT